MSDEELYELSLQRENYEKRPSKKRKKKHTYTHDADLAYAERYRRSGILRYAGVEKSCSKYQADVDYYGCYEPDYCEYYQED